MAFLSLSRSFHPFIARSSLSGTREATPHTTSIDWVPSAVSCGLSWVLFATGNGSKLPWAVIVGDHNIPMEPSCRQFGWQNDACYILVTPFFTVSRGGQFTGRGGVYLATLVCCISPMKILDRSRVALETVTLLHSETQQQSQPMGDGGCVWQFLAGADKSYRHGRRQNGNASSAMLFGSGTFQLGLGEQGGGTSPSPCNSLAWRLQANSAGDITVCGLRTALHALLKFL